MVKLENEKTELKSYDYFNNYTEINVIIVHCQNEI